MNRSRPRSRSRDSDNSGYEGRKTNNVKKKKGNRRNRLKRTNSNDSNFSSGGGNDSDFSYPSGFIEPPAWNQPAYNPHPSPTVMDSSQHRRANMSHYAHSNHSTQSGQSGYSQSSDERIDDNGYNQRTVNNRFAHQQQMQQKLQTQVQQQQMQQQMHQQSYTSPEPSPQPTKKKGIRRLLSRSRNKRKNSDDSISSKNSNRTFGMFRNKNAATANGNESDLGYTSDTHYNYSNTKFSPGQNNKPGVTRQIPDTLSFGHRSDDSNEFFDFDPSQSHNPNESEYGYSERDASYIEYDVPVVDKSDSEHSKNRFLQRGRFRGSNRPSFNQSDHMQMDGYSSSGSRSS